MSGAVEQAVAPSFRWYRAFRIMMLVLAILLAVAGVILVATGAFFQIAAADDVPPSDLIPLLNGIKTLFYQFIALIGLTDALFFATYFCLRKGSRTSVWLVYALNVWLPLTCLLMIPMLAGYFKTFFRGMKDLTDGSLDTGLSGISILVGTTIPVACVIYAIIIAAVLVPNSVYFHKRRDYIHPGVAY